MADDPSKTQPSRGMKDPTPEFLLRCRGVVERWEAGELPIREAITALRAHKQEAIDDHHLPNQGYAEHLMGYVEHLRGNLDSSIQHYRQARAIYQRIGNRVYMAQMDLNLGEDYRFKGDFDRALELYQDAYETTRLLNERRLEIFAAVNIGLAFLDLEEYENARQALESVLALAQNTGDFDQKSSVMCDIFYGLAVLHLKTGQAAPAWENARRALEVARGDGQPRTLGYASRLIGILLTELGDSPDNLFPDPPDDYFGRSIVAFKSVNAEAELARTLFAQARGMGKRGERMAAVRKFQQAMLLFNRMGMIDDAARAAEAQLNLI